MTDENFPQEIKVAEVVGLYMPKARFDVTESDTPVVDARRRYHDQYPGFLGTTRNVSIEVFPNPEYIAVSDNPCLDRTYYARIAATLRAGDIEASVISLGRADEPIGYGIKVNSEYGPVAWSNVDADGHSRTWGYTLVVVGFDGEGDAVTVVDLLPFDTEPDEVARFIATYVYPT